MLNGDAVTAIADLAQSEVKEFDGHKFHVTRSSAKSLAYPVAGTLRCFSLTQIVNFLKTSEMRVMINVASHSEVQVMSVDLNPNLQRHAFAEADFSRVAPDFPFGQKLSQEDFIINLMTKFESDGVRDDLVKMVNSVKAEKIGTSDDNGISQTASVRAGVHLSSATEVRNLWLLRTFKTFPEVEQPTIPYILRLHQHGEEMPKFALYDCDGGQWKVKLTATIREWLRNRINSELGDQTSRVILL